MNAVAEATGVAEHVGVGGMRTSSHHAPRTSHAPAAIPEAVWRSERASGSEVERRGARVTEPLARRMRHRWGSAPRVGSPSTAHSPGALIRPPSLQGESPSPAIPGGGVLCGHEGGEGVPTPPSPDTRIATAPTSSPCLNKLGAGLSSDEHRSVLHAQRSAQQHCTAWQRWLAPVTRSVRQRGKRP
jgi:hypothetical protein